MKTVFLGTDDFPVPALKALKEAGRAPDLVVTKPDAPRGRGRKIYPQKVRLVAEELGLQCEQPEDVLAPEFLERLRAFAPDLILVVSFGRILSEEFLAIPKKYCLNVHGSLLPRFRGAAPVAHAVLAGDPVTGVSVQKIAPKLDTGPILHSVETPIEKHEHAGELYNRLADLAGQALVDALEMVEQGKDAFVDQDDTKASRAPKLEKEQGFVDWEAEAVEIDRLVRAFTPKPGARTRFGPRKLILLEGRVEDDYFGLGMPGGVMTAGEEGIRVCTGKGIYRILRLKPENGRNMTAGEFVRGHAFPPDARFG
ncbi:MAG: methionyl-tRNA formyltransferase [Planctomycetes bacterium]|nr:methionyl-tRNA formyltransferase [Planctomycetota bacterium]MCB9919387.1 methionyl-tRNA formyltransferase [Planctomycetota bacterium]